MDLIDWLNLSKDQKYKFFKQSIFMFWKSSWSKMKLIDIFDQSVSPSLYFKDRHDQR